jgi:predicted small lipoprotein YifL
MKKLFLFVVLILTLSVAAACSDSGNEDTLETPNEENTAAESDEPEETEAAGEVEDLNLQLQKADEEAGVTVENNAVYSALSEAVEADPQIGVPNDFSLYPFDIAEFEDGSTSIIFLAINRLEDGIQNVSFDLTFGNQDGEYIFEDVEVYLPEDQFGVIEADSSVPFLLDITPEEETFFATLDMENVHMEMANFELEVVE